MYLCGFFYKKSSIKWQISSIDFIVSMRIRGYPLGSRAGPNHVKMRQANWAIYLRGPWMCHQVFIKYLAKIVIRRVSYVLVYAFQKLGPRYLRWQHYKNSMTLYKNLPSSANINQPNKTHYLVDHMVIKNAAGQIHYLCSINHTVLWSMTHLQIYNCTSYCMSNVFCMHLTFLEHRSPSN